MPSGRAPISRTGRAADQDPLAAAPIRILLVVARPEDDACGLYQPPLKQPRPGRDHGSTGGLVDLQILEPPTFPHLSAELQRAYDAGTPYH
jgi:hypothetical protein